MLYYNHKTSIDELLHQFDIALCQAKSAVRNALCFFDPQMQVSISNRMTMKNELHIALVTQQLQLFYQIQVDRLGSALVAEALVRWLHPECGLISPAEFILLAEDTGLTIPVGKWFQETACSQLEIWQNDAFTRELTNAVIISAKQFNQVDWVAHVQKLI
jgi:EAL domain-containing protein (putative c-di-GMP-specific phosphodiesterase class I)